MQTQSAPLLCCIENEKIMQLDYAGRPVKEVGVTAAQYQEALKVIQSYKDKLIEAGILKKEKSPQELQEETNNMLKSLIDKVNNLEKKVSDYEHGNPASGNPDVSSEEQIG